jgi:hypothetical protein
LDPTFKGVYPKVSRNQAQTQKTAEKTEVRHAKEPPSGGMGTGEAAAALALLVADPQSITRDIGTPLREHMAYARRLIDSIPVDIREAASDPFGARAVIYGLLLDHDNSIRNRQLAFLEKDADKPVYAAVEKILPDMSSLAEDARLPLMDLAMVSLRSMSMQQFRRFEENINNLVRADKRISLFEYTLQHVVVRRLERNFVKPQSSIREIRSIREVATEVSAVLSLLANLGHDDTDAPLAFREAAATLGQPGSGMKCLSRQECANVKFAAILDRLVKLSPKVKQQLIGAAFQCLIHDGRITMKEAEFFRLLVYALDCPLPPWVRI